MSIYEFTFEGRQALGLMIELEDAPGQFMIVATVEGRPTITAANTATLQVAEV